MIQACLSIKPRLTINADQGNCYLLVLFCTNIYLNSPFQLPHEAYPEFLQLREETEAKENKTESKR